MVTLLDPHQNGLPFALALDLAPISSAGEAASLYPNLYELHYVLKGTGTVRSASF